MLVYTICQLNPISLAKQWGQLGVICCSSSGIELCRAKTFQWTLIICDSLLSSSAPRTKLSSSLLVQKNRSITGKLDVLREVRFGSRKMYFCQSWQHFKTWLRHISKTSYITNIFTWKSRNMAYNKIKTLYFMLWLCSTVNFFFPVRETVLDICTHPSWFPASRHIE